MKIRHPMTLRHPVSYTCPKSSRPPHLPQCITWRIHDHPNVWYDWFVCVTDSYVWHTAAPKRCLSYTCPEWSRSPKSLLWVTCPVPMCDMTHPYLCMCGTWLIHMCVTLQPRSAAYIVCLKNGQGRRQRTFCSVRSHFFWDCAFWFLRSCHGKKTEKNATGNLWHESMYVMWCDVHFDLMDIFLDGYCSPVQCYSAHQGKHVRHCALWFLRSCHGETFHDMNPCFWCDVYFDLILIFQHCALWPFCSCHGKKK